jgi:hypothetical protein
MSKFIERDANGNITSVYAREQYDGQEFLPDDSVELLDMAALELERDVRAKRDALLAACDWTQTADSPLRDDVTWLEYRAALRDVPQQGGFPDNVVWPSKPAG